MYTYGKNNCLHKNKFRETEEDDKQRYKMKITHPILSQDAYEKLRNIRYAQLYLGNRMLPKPLN